MGFWLHQGKGIIPILNIVVTPIAILELSSVVTPRSIADFVRHKVGARFIFAPFVDGQILFTAFTDVIVEAPSTQISIFGEVVALGIVVLTGTNRIGLPIVMQKLAVLTV